MTIRPVGAELLHADGNTHTTKLIVAFRNFANAPKMDQQTGCTQRAGNFLISCATISFSKSTLFYCELVIKSVTVSDQFNMLVIITFAYDCFHHRM